VDSIADAPLRDIKECIKECGIHNRRAEYLKEGFDLIRKRHNGMVPASMEALTKLPGVGRKTATLLLNEGFGFYAGIGTDKHVCNVSLALGLFNKTHGLKNAAPDHVEASLRQWIPQRNFKDTNKVFGGMAQLITQDLATINTEEQRENLNIFLNAIHKRFHTAYEMELIWLIIGKIRVHYKAVAEKRVRAMEADEEESGDEAEEDESGDGVEEDG
jgi:endonuclease III